jgi:hypothetical protein
LGNENSYPILVLIKYYPKFRVLDNSVSGIPDPLEFTKNNNLYIILSTICVEFQQQFIEENNILYSLVQTEKLYSNKVIILSVQLTTRDKTQRRWQTFGS